MRAWRWLFVVLAVLLVASVSVSVASTADDLNLGVDTTAHGAAPIVARAYRILLTFGLTLLLLLSMALTAYVALVHPIRREPAPNLVPWDSPSSVVLDQPRL